MKILQVCPNFLPSMGGVETFVYNVSVDLLKKGNDVSVLCFGYKSEPLVDNINGIDVYRIKSFIKISSQQITLFLSRKISNVIKNIKPDIIHFHYPSPLLSNALLASMNKIKYKGKFYVHWHGDIVGRPLLKKWYTKSTIKLLSKSEKISSDTLNYAYHSIFLKEHLYKVSVIPAIPDKKALVNSGINMSEKEFIEKNSNKRTVIFGFGRFVKWKGFDYLIKSMNYLDENKYVLFLGGYGKYKKHLMKLAKNKNIFFVGPLNSSQKYTYLSMSDVFVFPSVGRQEAFGITLAEAMCLNKIPILFNKPDLGAREIAIPDYNCVCAEEISAFSLSKSIEYFCSLKKDIKELMICNIGKIIEEKLSYRALSEAVSNFYFQ